MENTSKENTTPNRKYLKGKHIKQSDLPSQIGSTSIEIPMDEEKCIY